MQAKLATYLALIIGNYLVNKRDIIKIVEFFDQKYPPLWEFLFLSVDVGVGHCLPCTMQMFLHH